MRLMVASDENGQVSGAWNAKSFIAQLGKTLEPKTVVEGTSYRPDDPLSDARWKVGLHNLRHRPPLHGPVERCGHITTS